MPEAEAIPCKRVTGTYLHDEVHGDAADLDAVRSSVTVPHVLMDLLGVAGCYPPLIITLLLVLLISPGLMLRALMLLSSLWANRDGLSFLGWRRQSSVMAHAVEVRNTSQTPGVAQPARRGGTGSHHQLLQLLLDAGQGGSPVQEGAELIALKGWADAGPSLGACAVGGHRTGALCPLLPRDSAGLHPHPQCLTLEHRSPVPYLGGQVEASEV